MDTLWHGIFVLVLVSWYMIWVNSGIFYFSTRKTQWQLWHITSRTSSPACILPSIAAGLSGWTPATNVLILLLSLFPASSSPNLPLLHLRSISCTKPGWSRYFLWTDPVGRIKIADLNCCYLTNSIKLARIIAV